MKPPSLSRQLVRVMAGLAIVTTLFVVVGSYAFYYLLAKYLPEAEPNAAAEWAFTTHEAAWFAITLILAIAGSALLATRLAQRILVPLNSVALSLKQLAHGDLSVRATGGDSALGEVSQLVDDFNAMASQLERVTQEQAQWHAAIAHELRTPVTILRGRLQGLADGVFEPSQALFQKLLSQVDGLTRLVEDLRVLGLTGSGHLHLQMVEADLSAEVRKVVEVFEPALQGSGHHVELRLAASKGYCDPVRIRQVLLALLENASKYAVPGTVRVTVGIDAQTCRLRVEDEGPGVPPATAQRMFDAFWRAEASRSRHGGGSGLGLAVVAAIARAHGGQATCTASAAGGTAIEVAWPNRAQQDLDAPVQRRVVHGTRQESEDVMQDVGQGGVSLEPLNRHDRSTFMKDLQEAFMAGVNDQLPLDPDDGPIPSDEDIAESLDAPGAVAYHILSGGQRVGGAVLLIDARTHHNSLAFFFVRPGVHGRGIGQRAWKLVEARFPQTIRWETHTPYFEKRNIHFYVNKCGFKIVEFFNERHPDPHGDDVDEQPFEDGMFRFEKQMGESRLGGR